MDFSPNFKDLNSFVNQLALEAKSIKDWLTKGEDEEEEKCATTAATTTIAKEDARTIKLQKKFRNCAKSFFIKGHPVPVKNIRQFFHEEEEEDEEGLSEDIFVALIEHNKQQCREYLDTLFSAEDKEVKEVHAKMLQEPSPYCFEAIQEYFAVLQQQEEKEEGEEKRGEADEEEERGGEEGVPLESSDITPMIQSSGEEERANTSFQSYDDDDDAKGKQVSDEAIKEASNQKEELQGSSTADESLEDSMECEDQIVQ